jgi:perosamine synthetase
MKLANGIASTPVVNNSTQLESETATTQMPFPYLEPETSPRPAGFIPIYEPWLGKLEEELVLETVRSTWISSAGKYIKQFEEEFAAYCGCRYGVATSNGTTSLHLATHALGIGAGDEVIVPALTFVACANAVQYTGARPIFADVDPVTWTISPESVAALITPQTKAIMPVHLFGQMAPMPELMALADAHNLQVIEDAAEAHGASINNKRAGTWGKIGSFSFFANKIITTGEGGMLITDDEALAARCRLLRDHGMPPERRYWHDEVGFNYRLTNMQAAVGVAQMTRIDEVIRRKREIAHQYAQELADVPGLVMNIERPGSRSVFWMVSMLIEAPFGLSRDELVVALRQEGIDSRPFFHPLDTLPPYRTNEPCPIALRLGRTGINLPSSPTLTHSQVSRICATLRRFATHE